MFKKRKVQSLQSYTVKTAVFDDAEITRGSKASECLGTGSGAVWPRPGKGLSSVLVPSSKDCHLSRTIMYDTLCTVSNPDGQGAGEASGQRLCAGRAWIWLSGCFGPGGGHGLGGLVAQDRVWAPCSVAGKNQEGGPVPMSSRRNCFTGPSPAGGVPEEPCLWSRSLCIKLCLCLKSQGQG